MRKYTGNRCQAKPDACRLREQGINDLEAQVAASVSIAFEREGRLHALWLDVVEATTKNCQNTVRGFLGIGTLCMHGENVTAGCGYEVLCSVYRSFSQMLLLLCISIIIGGFGEGSKLLMCCVGSSEMQVFLEADLINTSIYASISDIF